MDEERLPERPSKAQIESGLEQEGKRLLQKADSTPIVALCIEGKELSSPQLAQYVELSLIHIFQGFAGISVEGVMTGFGKCSGGRMKNRYPKGLRTL